MTLPTINQGSLPLATANADPFSHIAGGNLAQGSQVTSYTLPTGKLWTGAYTGQVASRCAVSTVFDATKNQYQGRTRHVAMDNITSLQLVYPGWYVLNPRSNGNVSEFNNTASVTLTASIEYPIGTRTQVKFSGSATGTITAGSLLTSDAVSVTIPIGATFFIWLFQQGASGIMVTNTPTMVSGLSSNSGEAANTAVSGLTDVTMSGTITNNAVGVKVTPVAIIGRTQRPTFLLIGDSRAQGTVDVFNDAFLLAGELERSIGQQFGYINISLGGERASDFATGTAAKRLLLAPYCSHVLSNYGINDLSNSRTSAQILADLATIRGLIGLTKPFYQGTVAPASTSTDSWATTVNQTTVAYNAARVTLNTAIRSGASGGIDGYFEIADAVENARDSGIWKVTGATFGYTQDGIHESMFGFQAVRSYRAIDDVVRMLA